MTDYSLLETGLDWMTVTTDNDATGLHWYTLFDQYANSWGPQKMERKEWKNRWYSGVRVENMTWGTSQNQGYIMIMAGEAARDWGLRLYPSVGKVTRLDLQVTVTLNRPMVNLATTEYQRNSNRKDRGYTNIVNSRSGNTLYVGSRHSDQFGRLYDKGVQTGSAEPGKKWRYECEIKKPRSMAIASRLYELKAEGRDVNPDIVGYVWEWFNRRGVRTLWNKGATSIVTSVGGRVSTLDKKLAWLRTQVAPSVDELVRAGLGRDVIDIFGPSLGEIYEQSSFVGIASTHEPDNAARDTEVASRLTQATQRRKGSTDRKTYKQLSFVGIANGK